RVRDAGKGDLLSRGPYAERGVARADARGERRAAGGGGRAGRRWRPPHGRGRPRHLDARRLRAAALCPEAQRVAGAAAGRAGAGAAAGAPARRGRAGAGGGGAPAGAAETGAGARPGRGAGDRDQGEGRGGEGACHAARQGARGVRAAARPGQEGHRGREGEGDPGTAAGGGRPLDRGRVPAGRAEPRFRSQQTPGAGIPGEPRAAAVKSVTIARNYAQALLLATAAEGEGEGEGGAQVEGYGRLLDAVAGAIQADERIAVVLESPRVAKAAKSRLLEQALREAAPAPFIRFLQAVVRRGRQ